MTTASIYDTATALNPAIKAKQQAMWASGDFAVIGTTLQIVGEVLCESIDLRSTERVLDVAAGNGNATLAAARRFARVTSTDYVPALLDRGRRRADAEALDVIFETADAEALPYPDASFDVALSTVGVMFTPNPERAAAELLRVVRPGGKIGLASWTPEGFIGQLFKVVGAHVPPPDGVPSPLQWGTEARVEELLGADAKVGSERRHFTFRYRSAEDFFETFTAFYGPTLKAWGALDEAGQRSFHDQLVALCESANRNTSGALTIDSEYLEVVATRR